MNQFKNICIQIHKWLGLVMSFMFLIWFLSGIVLIFVGFPHASRQERFEFLDTFTKQDFVGLKAPDASFKGKVELEKNLNKPVYRITSGRRAQKVYDAKSLKPVAGYSQAQAEQIATSYINRTVLKAEKILELDSWMPWSYYKPLLPLYVCYMDDAAHSRVYVSSISGYIVQHTTRKSRWLGRVGAIPHWIYFKQLRLHVTQWKNVVIAVSILGLLVCISGIILGFVRLKRNEKGKITALTPYKKWSYKWHHILGFVFGVFVFTFVLSGLCSVSGIPEWMVEKGTSPLKKWNGSNCNSSIVPQQIFNALKNKEGIRKIMWSSSMGKPVVEVFYDDYQKGKFYQLKEDSVKEIQTISLEETNRYAKNIFKNQHFTIQQLDKYTNYYKTSGMFYKPLPVYEIALDNQFNNCLFINPLSGRVVSAIDNNDRARRWFYRALHTFNFPIIEDYPWLRKILLVLISLIGLFISYTGAHIGIKKLKKNKRKSNNQQSYAS